MSQRRAAHRPWLVTGLAGGLAAVVMGLTGCASHVDTVDPNDYIQRQGDGMLRIQTPYANPTVPAGAIYPESCKSPPSFMGGPEDC